MICPCCNQAFGGRTFGDEKEKFSDLLHKTWREGMRAALLDSNMDRVNCRDKCPYPMEDVVRWYAWVGGAYHGICWRHDNPEAVAKWIAEENNVNRSTENRHH